MTVDVASDVVGILQGVGAEVHELRVTASTFRDPEVEIQFGTVQDLTAFAQADKAKVDVLRKGSSRMQSPLSRDYRLYSASYDRPGRRMLLQHYHYQHCQCLAGDQQ